MKKVISILFLTTYLFSTTELHQLLKLPVVFEHFAEHKKQDKDISFLQFLDMHYMHGSPNDKDHNEDMKLPFKTADNCMSSMSPVIVPSLMPVFLYNAVRISQKEVYIHQDEFVPSSYLSCIWQPPKSC